MNAPQVSSLETVRVILGMAAGDLQRLERFVGRMLSERRDDDLVASSLQNELINVKRMINCLQVASREIADSRFQLSLEV